MAEAIKWRDNVIDVQAWLVPRFLWMTASIDVFLNGQRILRTGGPPKFTGSRSEIFVHAGETHKVELRWGVSFWHAFPYKLYLDDILIKESKVPVQNWLRGIFFASASIITFLSLVFLVLHFFRF